MQEACDRLPKDGLLIIYGPFCHNGCHNSASNAAFDASLRQRDPRWGLRDLDWIDDLLTHRPMNLVGRHAMPANNTTLVLRRR